MRLKSANAVIPYIDQVDREGGDPNGKPLNGATTWKLRPLTVSMEGAITDDMVDLGRTTFKPTNNGETAEADVKMTVSASKMKINRVRLGIVGWEGLYVDAEGADAEDADAFTELPFTLETVVVGGQEFKGAPGAVIDMLDKHLLDRIDRKIKELSGVQPGMGN